jgi:protein TonB
MKKLSPAQNSASDVNLPRALHANSILNAKRHDLEVYESMLDFKRDREKIQNERKPLFFFIGLTISLLMVVIAFNWKTYDNSALLDLGNVQGDFDEIIEVPTSIQPPPPPPQKMEVFTVKEVDDNVIIEEIKLDLDVELTEEMKVADVVFEVFDEPVEEKAEEIFQIVEQSPAFPGGIGEFYKYVAQNIEYPALASRLGVSGRVFVRFVIEKDGSLTDIRVVKGIGSGCDVEAARVLEGSPKWTPGKQRGNNVRVYMTVPIHFLLRQ